MVRQAHHEPKGSNRAFAGMTEELRKGLPEGENGNSLPRCGGGLGRGLRAGELLVGHDTDSCAVDDDEEPVARSLGDLPNEAVELGDGNG